VTQVAFAEGDDEIEAFAANRTDDAFGERIRGAMTAWRMPMRATRRWKSAP
jgi:hypothetical protein